MKEQMRIVVMDNLEVVKKAIEDSEIPDMLDSGFFTAVLRQGNAGIEYANVNWDEWTITWVTVEAEA